MSENWYVVHTQPRGEKMLKALLDREPAVADTYLPMRQQFAIVGGQRVSRMALTMPGLVFVRGNKNHIVALLREKSGGFQPPPRRSASRSTTRWPSTPP